MRETTLMRRGEKLVIHIVPFDGIGGVEVAACTTPDTEQPNFHFRKFFLIDNVHATGSAQDAAPNPSLWALSHPRVYCRAIHKLLRLHPQLVIASLWRSYLVAIALKLLQPSTRLITFVHSSSDRHFFDKVLSRIAMWLSTEIWADSQASLGARVPLRHHGRSRVISFLIERQALPTQHAPAPTFIFWGRLHRLKDLSHTFRLFALIHAQRPDAKFLVIGPDCGDRAALEQQVAALGLGSAVKFAGGMDRAAIFTAARECSFYLQTSQVEGMAMSVIEAMQLGLVPVVTPVGEIGNYCRDGENAVLVTEDEAAARQTLALIEDAAAFRRMSNSAIETWQTKRLYREDVMAACQQILAE